MSSCNKVQFGPYIGKSKPELLVILRAAQDRLAGGGGQLIGASVNGQSFQKSGGATVRTEIREITAALAQVDPDYIAPSHTIAARFRSCY
jgi:hypothetical protein